MRPFLIPSSLHIPCLVQTCSHLLFPSRNCHSTWWIPAIPRVPPRAVPCRRLPPHLLRVVLFLSLKVLLRLRTAHPFQATRLRSRTSAKIIPLSMKPVHHPAESSRGGFRREPTTRPVTKVRNRSPWFIIGRQDTMSLKRFKTSPMTLLQRNGRWIWLPSRNKASQGLLTAHNSLGRLPATRIQSLSRQSPNEALINSTGTSVSTAASYFQIKYCTRCTWAITISRIRSSATSADSGQRTGVTSSAISAWWPTTETAPRSVSGKPADLPRNRKTPASAWLVYFLLTSQKLQRLCETCISKFISKQDCGRWTQR